MNRKELKDFIKAVLAIAIPVALQNLLSTTATMVDAMMLAPLGELTIGAVGLCAQFASLMFSCYWGFVAGGMLFFAQYYGAKDDEGIERSYGITAICMMFVGVTFTILALGFPDQIMRMFTDKTELYDIGISYLRIDGFAYIPQVYAVLMSSLLRSTERVKIPLYSGIAAVITNVFLNYILIFGHLGMPAMGARGAALATVISGCVNVIVLWILSYKSGFDYIFRFRKHFAWRKEGVKEFFVKSFPILCNELFIGASTLFINMVLGRQSAEAIAAFAVFRTLEGFIIGFFSGFSNAASVLVGKSVGEGNLKVAYERAKRLVPMCAITIFGLGLILFAVHKPLLTAMGLSGESYRIGTGVLLIFSGVAIIRMCNWTQNDTYRSAGDPAYGSILEIVFMYVLVLPAVYLAGIKYRIPVLYVFALCYIDEPIRFVLMQIHMYSGKWIKPVTEQGKLAKENFM